MAAILARREKNKRQAANFGNEFAHLHEELYGAIEDVQEGVDRRVGSMEVRLGEVSTQVGEVSTQVGEVGTQVGEVDRKVGEVDRMVGEVDRKVDAVASSAREETGAVLQRMIHLEERFAAMENGAVAGMTIYPQIRPYGSEPIGLMGGGKAKRSF